MTVRDTDFIASAPSNGFLLPGDLTHLRIGTQDIVFSLNGSGGVSRFSLSNRGGLDLIGTQFTSPSDVVRPQDTNFIGAMTALGVAGEGYLYGLATLSQAGRSLVTFDAATGGRLTRVASDPGLSRFGTDIETVVVGGDRYALVMDGYGDFLETHRIGANGRLTFSSRLALSPQGEGAFPDFASVAVGDRRFVIYALAFDPLAPHPLGVVEVRSSGRMAQRYRLEVDDPGLFNRNINDIETAVIGGRSFAFVAENTSGAIVVYQVDQSGRLSLIDEERLGLSDDWGFARKLEHFEHQGRHYLLAAGESIGVFEISAYGDLHEVDEARVATFGGLNAVDVVAVDRAGEQFFVAATRLDAGLRAFRFRRDADDERTGTSRGERITGGNQDDQIRSLGGSDTVLGGAGDDLVLAGDGNDVADGGAGADVLRGESGRDTLTGGADVDRLWGGGDADSLNGGDGSDFLDGGTGADSLSGVGGDDRLTGGAGNDRLSGGPGNDRLIDGSGADQLTGGSGLDRFVLVVDRATDTIADWERGDRIDLISFGEDLSFADLDFRNQGANRVDIRIEGETLVVRGAAGGLTLDDFGFTDFVFA